MMKQKIKKIIKFPSLKNKITEDKKSCHDEEKQIFKVLRFLKVFLITSFVSILLIMVGFYSYLRIFNPLDKLGHEIINNPEFDDFNNTEDNPNATPFERAIKDSSRVNVLVVGLEHVRTDTIMLASYDRKNKVANLISIPRDTFYERDGYYGDGLKINAIYQSEDVDGLIDAVESLTKIPVHRYVLVDYEAVIKGIDALGGVEIDVPFHMIDSDPYENPPRYINIPAGRQTLYGEDSLKFLRYRKGYFNGDIGRINAQQQFVKETIKKLLSLRLPNFIKEVYPYISTDFLITELIALASESIGFTMDNLNTDILPGEDRYIGKLSFFIPNYEEALQLTYTMYGVIEENSETSENE